MNTGSTNDLLEGHTYRTLDLLLSEVRLQTITMGALVVNQVNSAVQALLRSDGALATQVLTLEEEVNEQQRTLERAVFEILARHQLVASDLRFALADMRIVNQLERVGDEARKIASFAERVAAGGSHAPTGKVAPYLRHMAELSTMLLSEALRALDESDLPLAKTTAARDAELDEEFAAALRSVFTLVMAGEPYLRATVDTVFALKGLERIGDHAKNIAEQVLFIAGQA